MRETGRKRTTSCCATCWGTCVKLVRHPSLRMLCLVCVLVLNMLMFSEDPQSYSGSLLEIPILGRAFNFLFGHYPSWGLNRDWLAAKISTVICFSVVGIVLGEFLVRRLLLRTVFRLGGFKRWNGFLLVACVSFVLSVWFAAQAFQLAVENSHAYRVGFGASQSTSETGFDAKDMDEDGWCDDPEESYLTKNKVVWRRKALDLVRSVEGHKLPMRNATFAVLALYATFLGDCYALFAVLDDVLQDKKRYPGCAKRCKHRCWPLVRVPLFWIYLALVLLIIAGHGLHVLSRGGGRLNWQGNFVPAEPTGFPDDAFAGYSFPEPAKSECMSDEDSDVYGKACFYELPYDACWTSGAENGTSIGGSNPINRDLTSGSLLFAEFLTTRTPSRPRTCQTLYESDSRSALYRYGTKTDSSVWYKVATDARLETQNDLDENAFRIASLSLLGEFAKRGFVFFSSRFPNRGFFGFSELGRTALASVILLLNLIIVMQDPWYPHYGYHDDWFDTYRKAKLKVKAANYVISDVPEERSPEEDDVFESPMIPGLYTDRISLPDCGRVRAFASACLRCCCVKKMTVIYPSRNSHFGAGWTNAEAWDVKRKTLDNPLRCKSCCEKRTPGIYSLAVLSNSDSDSAFESIEGTDDDEYLRDVSEDETEINCFDCCCVRSDSTVSTRRKALEQESSCGEEDSREKYEFFLKKAKLKRKNEFITARWITMMFLITVTGLDALNLISQATYVPSEFGQLVDSRGYVHSVLMYSDEMAVTGENDVDFVRRWLRGSNDTVKERYVYDFLARLCPHEVDGMCLDPWCLADERKVSKKRLPVPSMESSAFRMTFQETSGATKTDAGGFASAFEDVVADPDDSVVIDANAAFDEYDPSEWTSGPLFEPKSGVSSSTFAAFPANASRITSDKKRKSSWKWLEHFWTRGSFAFRDPNASWTAEATHVFRSTQCVCRMFNALSVSSFETLPEHRNHLKMKIVAETESGTLRVCAGKTTHLVAEGKNLASPCKKSLTYEMKIEHSDLMEMLRNEELPIDPTEWSSDRYLMAANRYAWLHDTEKRDDKSDARCQDCFGMFTETRASASGRKPAADALHRSRELRYSGHVRSIGNASAPEGIFFGVDCVYAKFENENNRTRSEEDWGLPSLPTLVLTEHECVLTSGPLNVMYEKADYASKLAICMLPLVVIAMVALRVVSEHVTRALHKWMLKRRMCNDFSGIEGVYSQQHKRGCAGKCQKTCAASRKCLFKCCVRLHCRKSRYDVL